MNQQPFGNFDVAQVFGNLGRTGHRTADKRHFSTVFPRQLDSQLDAMDGGGKTGDEQPPLGAGEHLIKLASHSPLTRRVSFALDVGRILKQRQNSLFAIFRERVQVEHLVVRGGRVNLEVARVNQHSEGRVDGQRNTIYKTVGNVDGMNRERARLKSLACTDLVQIRIIQQPMFFQFVFYVRERELGSPHWYIEFGKNPRQSADVILVAMGENDGAHPLPVFDEIGNVGNYDVHAQQLGLGEHETRVDDDNVIAPAYRHAVHSELAQTAEGYDVQFSSWHFRCPLIVA